jgi:putative glutamine amidotransferase
MQLLNVALGGTLIQDIPSERRTTLTHADSAARGRRVHAAECEAGSRFGEAVGATLVSVNSSHHQAIDHVAPALRVSARAPDGIIEAVETVDPHWWVLGAQWHPEELVATPEPWDRNLFAAFAAMMHETTERRAAPAGPSARR